MKNIFTLFSVLIIQQFLIAQTTENYLIEFKNKTGSKFSINKPSDFLSEKSIQRRVNQNIKLNSTDLPVNPDYVLGVKSIGVSVSSQSKWLNALCVSTTDISKIKLIEQLPFVKNIVLLSNSSSEKLPSKYDFENYKSSTPYEKTDALINAKTLNYGLTFKQASQISVDCLHDQGFLGQGMTIAVIDAGFQNVNTLATFDSMFVNHHLLGCRDFVTGDTMVFEDYIHGMNVLSCMAGNLPGRIVGTAINANYWLLRTENISSETLQEEVDWAIAAEFADSVGADIITSSLGYNKFDGGIGDHFYSDMNGNTTIITKAADLAASKGIFVLSAAGNEASKPWHYIAAPADADSVLTVGAVDSIGVIGSFSSRGPTSDARIKPDVCARGVSAYVANLTNDVYTQNGTSFSTPIMAGAVACLWQANPTKNNMEIFAAIQKSASQYSTPDSVKGYGIPNFCLANTLLIGIDEYKINTNYLDVYPNPFSTDFNVSFYSEEKQIINIEVFDIANRLIFQEEKNINPYSSNVFYFPDLNNQLTEGVYIIRVVTTQKAYCKKLIKIK